MQFIISIVGVLVFIEPTAHDDERIKEMYFAEDAPETAQKKAIMGVLALYLDFVNLFLLFVQLFGSRRDD